MQQTKWFDRKFNFNVSQAVFPSLLERLVGTPGRLEEKVKNIPPAFLTASIDNSWSIKENIGHLADLEPLWQVRIEDLIESKPALTPADLQNTKTHLAHHNDTTVEDLLRIFRELREKTVQMAENLDEEILLRSALHPRLQTPMRMADHFLFVAEHDDHHLATITELVKLLKDKK